LYFDKAIWNLPVKSFNKTLHQYFKRLAEEQLLYLKKEKSLNYQVKCYLLSNVNQQLPSIEQTAEHLELNVRTMQRRLKQEGLTFQQLTDTIRKDLAIDVLRKQKGKIEEVAHFLGYSEASVFRRAFKRWTGLTPSVFLQQNH
jgi:AraC-like DNA-binding protein